MIFKHHVISNVDFYKIFLDLEKKLFTIYFRELNIVFSIILIHVKNLCSSLSDAVNISRYVPVADARVVCDILFLPGVLDVRYFCAEWHLHSYSCYRGSLGEIARNLLEIPRNEQPGQFLVLCGKFVKNRVINLMQSFVLHFSDLVFQSWVDFRLNGMFANCIQIIVDLF